MSLRIWKLISLLLVAALLITSCGSGPFAGETGIQEAAQETQPKPPLEIAANHGPLLNPETPLFVRPYPVVRPFAVGNALYRAALTTFEDDLAAGFALPAEFVPTPVPQVVGPALAWSQTDNYLVLGTDHRPGWSNWRTDSLIVVGIDRPNGRIAVFSVPRDLYVQIPNYGWGGINQVDYLGERAEPGGGGPRLVSQVLFNNLGIATNHWIRIRMDGFMDVVDAVGGVTVRLDCPFYEPIFNLTTDAWDYFALPAGDNWMDGETAYWFVRLRLRESDIGRSRRQRQFLWALRDQMVNTNLVARVPELWNAFQSTFTTDMTLLQMIDLANWGISVDPANVRAGGLSLSDLQNYTTAEGASVLRIADPVRVANVVAGVWNAPAMIDANRQDVTKCPPLPAGIDFTTATAPDLTQTDPDNTGAPAPPPELSAPVEVPTAAPQAEVDTSLFPTPTPAAVSISAPTADDGG